MSEKETKREATITIPNPLKFLRRMSLGELQDKEIEVTIKLREVEKEEQ